MNPYNQNWHHVQNFIHTNKRHKKYCTVILQSAVTELRQLPDSIMVYKNGTHLLTPLLLLLLSISGYLLQHSVLQFHLQQKLHTNYGTEGPILPSLKSYQLVECSSPLLMVWNLGDHLYICKLWNPTGLNSRPYILVRPLQNNDLPSSIESSETFNAGDTTVFSVISSHDFVCTSLNYTLELFTWYIDDCLTSCPRK